MVSEGRISNMTENEVESRSCSPRYVHPSSSCLLERHYRWNLRLGVIDGSTSNGTENEEFEMGTTILELFTGKTLWMVTGNQMVRKKIRSTKRMGIVLNLHVDSDQRQNLQRDRVTENKVMESRLL